MLGNVMTLGSSGHMWTGQTQSGLGNDGFGMLTNRLPIPWTPIEIGIRIIGMNGQRDEPE